MTPRFFLRRTQALWTTILLGSLAACANIQHESDRTRTEGAASGGGASATRESALDAQISGLRQQVAARRQENEALRNLVAAKEQQLTTILASDRTAGPSVQEFDLRSSIDAKLREIDQQASSWQELIDAHQAVMQKAKDDPHGGELQTQIDQLTEQRAELLRLRARLVGITDKLKR